MNDLKPINSLKSEQDLKHLQKLEEYLKGHGVRTIEDLKIAQSVQDVKPTGLPIKLVKVDPPEGCEKIPPRIGFSILNCNLCNVTSQVEEVCEAKVDFIHLDVMDGVFVDDITFGTSYIQQFVKYFSDYEIEVHMMVSNPLKFVQAIASTGVKRFIFHYEASSENSNDICGKCCCNNRASCYDIIKEIKMNKMDVGMAINPETSWLKIMDYIPFIDHILVMSVHPGKGGQQFMPEVLKKVKEIRDKFPYTDVGLDGGCNVTNSELSGQHQVNSIVVGSALIKSKKKKEDIDKMRNDLHSLPFIFATEFDPDKNSLGNTN